RCRSTASSASGAPLRSAHADVGWARRVPTRRLLDGSRQLRARRAAEPQQRRGPRQPGRRLPGGPALPGSRDRVPTAGLSQRPRLRAAVQPRLASVLSEPPWRRDGSVGLALLARLPAGLLGDLYLPLNALRLGRVTARPSRPPDRP